MTAHNIPPSEILTFWKDAGPGKWFVKDTAFDETIRTRFLKSWEAAQRGALRSWEESDEGLLALIILCDQFPRNMFRNDAKAFSTDGEACRLARLALDRGLDRRIEATLRPFVYLPFEHSEDIEDQRKSMALFSTLDDAKSRTFAEIHFDIIERFGRFPHRNTVLGRKSTEEEQKFLDNGGFAG